MLNKAKHPYRHQDLSQASGFLAPLGMTNLGC
jgi:hypothetical protein